MPDRIRVIASPSNSGQVKIAGDLLSQLRDRLDAKRDKRRQSGCGAPRRKPAAADALFPARGDGEVNLTMGYPLRLTSVVAYVTLLRRMLHNSRLSSGDRAFYHRDIRLRMAIHSPIPASDLRPSVRSMVFSTRTISRSSRLMRLAPYLRRWRASCVGSPRRCLPMRRLIISTAY